MIGGPGGDDNGGGGEGIIIDGQWLRLGGEAWNIIFQFLEQFFFSTRSGRIQWSETNKKNVKQNVSKHKYFSAGKHLHFEIDMKKKTTPWNFETSNFELWNFWKQKTKPVIWMNLKTFWCLLKLVVTMRTEDFEILNIRTENFKKNMNFGAAGALNWKFILKAHKFARPRAPAWWRGRPSTPRWSWRWSCWTSCCLGEIVRLSFSRCAWWF